MADSKLTALSEDTAPDATDIIYEVQDPSGTPASKKVQFSNVHKALTVFTGDSGAGGAKGLVPAPASGDAAASKYLKADGSWTAITIPPSVSYDYLSTLVNTEVSITGATTANWGNQHVVTGSTNYTINLQTCSGNTGKFMSFRILNTGVTTLDGNSAETIEGATTIPCYQGQNIILYSDGSNAHVLTQKAAGRSFTVSGLGIRVPEAASILFNTAMVNGYDVYQTTPNDGDYFEFWAFCEKGNWTLSHAAHTAAAHGKLDWTLNGVALTNGQAVDWYSASTVYGVVKTFTFDVPYTGLHKFRGTIDGKNASASNYYFVVSQIDGYYNG